MVHSSSDLPARVAKGPHVVGLFATREQAEAAVEALLAASFPSDAISAVTAEGKDLTFPSGDDPVQTGARNAAIGAAVGAAGGFVILGPLMLLAGAVVGGVFGLMTTLGASHEHAEYLTERIRSGHYMVIVHTADNVPTAESILENAGGTDVHSMSA